MRDAAQSQVLLLGPLMICICEEEIFLHCVASDQS